MSGDYVSPEPKLPDWIRRAQRGTDWGILAAILVSLAASWTFILHSDLPRTNDLESYVFRTWDTMEAFREGWLYPRWSPHAQYGYGAPIPNYYPPGAALISAFLGVLFTDSAVAAVRMVLIASFVIAGTGMYAFMLKRHNAATGLTAALLYVLSPYFGLTLPHAIGHLPEFIAMALLPGMLWAVHRLLYVNSAHDIGLVSVIFAALVFTDPRYALFGLFALLPLLLHSSPSQRRILLKALLISGLVSACFWLPATMEYGAASWLQPDHPPAERLNLVKLFNPMQSLDPAAMRPQPQFSLGWAICLFALAGISRLRSFSAQRHFYLLFALLGLILVILALIVPASTWLLGPITLCLTIFGSTGTVDGVTNNGAPRRIAFVTGILMIMVLAFPIWQGKPTPPPFGDIDANTQVQGYELLGYGTAVLSADAALPTTLSADATPSRMLINNYGIGILNRFGDDSRQQAYASLLWSNGYSQGYQLRLPTEIQITLLLAYYPGWRAKFNGEDVPLSADMNGLITINLPSTRNEQLEVSFHTTPIRQLSWLITTSGMILLILWIRHRVVTLQHPGYEDDELLSIPAVRLLLAGMIIFAFGFVMLSSNGQIRPFPGSELWGSVSLMNRSDSGLTAQALRLDADEYQAGDEVSFTIYWDTNRNLTSNYQYRLFLRDVAGSRNIVQLPYMQLSDIPTRRWERGQFATTRGNLQIPKDTPTGRYTLALAVYRCDPACTESDTLTFFDRSGAAVGPRLTLPQVITIHRDS